METEYEPEAEIFKLRNLEFELSPETDVSWPESDPSYVDPSESSDSDPSEYETFILSTNAFSRVNYE